MLMYLFSSLEVDVIKEKSMVYHKLQNMKHNQFSHYTRVEDL